MNIAIVLPSLRNVGPVRVALDIASELKKNGLDPVVFYLDDKVELTYPGRSFRLTFANIWQLYKFDVVHSHMLRPDILVGVLPFFRGSKISTLHNIVETDLYYSHGKKISWLFSRVWRLFWRRMDRCVVLSKVAFEYYIDFGLSSEKVFIIYNGVGEPESSEAPQTDVAEKIKFLKHRYTILGTVALFNKRKGLEQVVKSLPFQENCCFVIIGDGPERRGLEALANNLGVKDRVIFLGFLQKAKIYIGMFDVYMMPSREEGFSLALLDAVSVGVPTVCSAIPVFTEAFKKDEVAFFELDDLCALKKSVEVALVNGPRMAQLAKNRMRKNYTKEVMASKYLELYSE